MPGATAHRDMRGFPETPPPYEMWGGGTPPAVRLPSQVKAGNRKGEKRADYIAEQIAADEKALEEWSAQRRERYDQLWLEHDQQVETLRATTALEAYYGGTIACIGVALADGAVKVLHPLNDPELRSSLRQDYLGQQADREVRHRLYRAMEYRLLARLAAVIRWAEQDGPPVKLTAWNGFGFDFRFVALASLRHATITEHTAAVSEHAVGSMCPDMALLIRRCWHGRPWKASHLRDPRETWSFGGSQRIGRLLGVAEFLGFEVPQWAIEFSHSQIPEMLDHPAQEYVGPVPCTIAGQGAPVRPRNIDAIAEVCSVDVDALRHIDQTLDAMGAG